MPLSHLPFPFGSSLPEDPSALYLCLVVGLHASLIYGTLVPSWVPSRMSSTRHTMWALCRLSVLGRWGSSCLSLVRKVSSGVCVEQILLRWADIKMGFSTLILKIFFLTLRIEARAFARIYSLIIVLF